jgi:SAM-dependent methyltransferase
VRWTYASGWTASLWRSARQALAERGVGYVLRVGVLWATFPVWRVWFRRFPRTFRFRGATYVCLFHRYNSTWSNERAVEVPIVRALVAGRRGGRILEVGNVLSHYVAAEHETLDKFESGPGIRNEDVVAFRSTAPYDLIVSISTLEHVGWDEEPKDPGKIPRAIDNLAGQLAPGGQLVVTLPLGYNPDLDALLSAGALPFTRIDCLKRRGWWRWEEASWEEVRGARYGEGRPGAAGLVIATVER